MYNISTIIAFHNRKEKTLSCLKNLFQALEFYNNKTINTNRIKMKIFLTDDGSTDGTSDAIKSAYTNEDIMILKGDGSLYWTRGMCLAWDEALKEDSDFYLLLNDDTNVIENLFQELINTHEYCLRLYGKPGLYSGIISDPVNTSKTVYGGRVKRILGMSELLNPVGIPQNCDLTVSNR